MATKTVNGKLPFSKKPMSKNSIKEMFRTRNILNVPEHVSDWLAKQGMEYRWIDSKKYKDMGGVHPNFWQVVQVPEEMRSQTSFLGAPSDGTIRRGTLVLASRKTEIGDVHREELRERATKGTQYAKAKARELRDDMRNANADGIITEGYEEDS